MGSAYHLTSLFDQSEIQRAAENIMLHLGNEQWRVILEKLVVPDEEDLVTLPSRVSNLLKGL